MISRVSPHPEPLQAQALDGSAVTDLDAAMQIDPNRVSFPDLQPVMPSG
jgi:hypothetical protein